MKKYKNISVRPYEPEDIPRLTEIWNETVEAGNAFPQESPMTEEEAAEFFASQTFTGAAEYKGEVAGLYILHPNNVGRCGHIANASYAVSSKVRGKGVGRVLVEHSLFIAKQRGFRLLQFNAVVASNRAATALYEKLGFVQIGTVEGGYRNINNQYEDIILFYHKL